MKRKKVRPIKKIQQEILITLIILVSIMTILITVISIFLNIKSESNYLDENLQNIAYTISQSQIVQEELAADNSENSASIVKPYLDTLKSSLSNIDVISVVGSDQVRKYHTNSELIGTVYDGTLPDFQNESKLIYVTSDIGPSGSQRRAYAAIYDSDGNYSGFVLAVMLKQNINRVVINAITIHLICAVTVIICAVIFSKYLSTKIKKMLFGYEPSTFSAMFSTRDNILESLEEGIIAVGTDEKIIYINKAARKMLYVEDNQSENNKISRICPELALKQTLTLGEKYFGVSINSSKGNDILADQIPVMEHEQIVGALCILRDRTEYTKIMEDLSGVKYMVESMRANNHDFINKLHVILGLIQIGNTTEASEYIMNITAIQQKVIHKIMKSIEDPSVAALLIGKYSRAAELNIQFTLKSSSRLSRSEISLSSGDLVTIIGNLLDNAMDSINEKAEQPKELSVGIYTKPHALLISVDDTGTGIAPENKNAIFENGFSTKGENHGFGLHIVNNLIQKYNGTISVDSELGTGTSFTVTLTDEGGINHV